MFDLILIETTGNGKLGTEEQLVYDVMKDQQTSIHVCSLKKFRRSTQPPSANSFVVGTIPFIKTALAKLGKPIPESNDYPECLKQFRHRKIWLSTLREVEDQLWDSARPVFMKPADRLKNFNGRVFEHPNDLYFTYNASRRQRVWCSEVVEWKSEYRVYVVNDIIQHIGHYDGDESILIDQSIVENAITTFRESSEAPCAYAIDFGVLECGRTALIEVNDAYSLGAYSIDAHLYTRMLLNRWIEIVNQETN